MHIPYTASRVTANAIALDKTLTKRVWRDVGLPVAPFQEFVTGNEPIDPSLKYPVFVKPSREGTGMGMGASSICNNSYELRARIKWVIEKYNQPALVEEYFLSGPRTYSDRRVGSPGWQTIQSPSSVLSGRWIPIVCLSWKWTIPDPSPLVSMATTQKLWSSVRRAFRILFARQKSPLPSPEHSKTLPSVGIKPSVQWTFPASISVAIAPENRSCWRSIPCQVYHPDLAILCVIANAEGISYRNLILEILYLGASRYGLVEQASEVQAELEVFIPYAHSRIQRQKTSIRQPATLRARSLLR